MIKIDTGAYEKAHRGRKPGGHREAWCFNVTVGGRRFQAKFENCEYSTAARLLREQARRFQYHGAIAEVAP